MKRVKMEGHGHNRAKQAGVRLSLLLAGLMLASAGAQASVTIAAGNRVVDRIGGAISLRTPAIEVNRNAGWITLASPGYVIQPPSALPLNVPSASSSVNGNMSYSVGTSHGSFSEGDASSDGSTVALELNRKGYGYRAEASAETGLAQARAETKWVAGSGYGYSYGNSAASATSTWSDWFVISGGTGVGVASFASVLEGTMTSGKSGSASYALNIGYAPAGYCAHWYAACGEADFSQSLFSQSTTLSGKGKSTLSQDVEGEFAFAYGKAFKLTVALDVSAANGGMADFSLASLGTSLVLPEGATLLSASGLPYVQAVPEADVYATMLAGLGVVGWAARRRRHTASFDRLRLRREPVERTNGVTT